MKLSVTVLALAVLIAACSPDTSAIQHGEVTPYNAGRPSEPWALTTEQAVAVSGWLDSHRSNWNLDLLGDYVPALIAKLQNKNGAVRINIMGSYVVYYDGHHQYGANFSPQDVAKLRRALGADATANQRLERP